MGADLEHSLAAFELAAACHDFAPLAFGLMDIFGPTRPEGCPGMEASAQHPLPERERKLTPAERSGVRDPLRKIRSVSNQL